MKIPTRINVGRTEYSIERPHTIDNPRAYGLTHFDEARIEIAQTNGYGHVCEADVLDETFWHEVTHCILHDMKHPEAYREAFVTAFSKRLTGAINSAVFDDMAQEAPKPAPAQKEAILMTLEMHGYKYLDCISSVEGDRRGALLRPDGVLCWFFGSPEVTLPQVFNHFLQLHRGKNA